MGKYSNQKRSERPSVDLWLSQVREMDKRGIEVKSRPFPETDKRQVDEVCDLNRLRTRASLLVHHEPLDLPGAHQCQRCGETLPADPAKAGARLKRRVYLSSGAQIGFYICRACFE